MRTPISLFLEMALFLISGLENGSLILKPVSFLEISLLDIFGEDEKRVIPVIAPFICAYSMTLSFSLVF